ncbi:MAG: energy-coupling factor transporter transmembrane component T, partial [Clostridia bacterium]
MFRDVSFGQYYPTNSVVHRLDARVKLLLTILFVVGIFFIKTYFGFMLTIALLLTVILFARLPMMSVLKSVKGILFIVVFAAVLNLFLIKGGDVLVHWSIFTITKTGVHTTIKMILRLVLLISGASILSLTTTPVDLADGMASLMR